MTVKSKKTKLMEARKNAEALKAKKKEVRSSRSVSDASTKTGVKGKSIIGQAKKKN